ncbi:MAG TPA: lactate racemase domain-containing protein [Abditibacteriaceae bacterium]|jgi:nickel-dependent lactate racemase
MISIPQKTVGAGYDDRLVSDAEAHAIAAEFLGSLQLEGKRILLIVPDATRTAPVGLMFRAIFQQTESRIQKLDVMVALGTHQPMTEAQICERLEISAQERSDIYGDVALLNHEWDNPAQLQNIGVIPSDEISTLSDGRFAMDVNVEINRAIFDYDLLLILGPVFPHEVVGFSGGNKYLFPGIGGAEILNFFHWLGAVIANPKIIGNKWTPVRRVVDRAAQLVSVPRACFCMVVEKGGLAGLYAGTPEGAWDAASDLSDALHIVYTDRAYDTVLSCAPTMYDDLWTGGKCMYKLEPVVADGGELIIYAPHITEVSVTHGDLIEEIGYHTRDYFLSQWDKFKDLPWGILAHSTHVRGIGTMEDGVEKPRVKVTLASQISPEVCAKINLGYRDPSTINVEDFANRENEGVLLVRKAGEMLYRLKDAPEWQQG